MDRLDRLADLAGVKVINEKHKIDYSPEETPEPEDGPERDDLYDIHDILDSLDRVRGSIMNLGDQFTYGHNEDLRNYFSDDILKVADDFVEFREKYDSDYYDDFDSTYDGHSQEEEYRDEERSREWREFKKLEGELKSDVKMQTTAAIKDLGDKLKRINDAGKDIGSYESSPEHESMRKSPEVRGYQDRNDGFMRSYLSRNKQKSSRLANFKKFDRISKRDRAI
jgi:hypothetical protein